MNTDRKKQIKLDAIIKVQAFLQDCKKRIEAGELFSIDKLARSLNITGSTGTHAIRLGILNQELIKGEYSIGDNFGTDRTTAKRIIESIRIADVERKQNAIDNKSKLLNLSENNEVQQTNGKNSNIDTVPEIKRNTDAEITSLLKKALSTATPLNNQSLFSSQEKEFDDKLKIACAIATAYYSVDQTTPYHTVNECIERIATDLYNKLKNNN